VARGTVTASGAIPARARRTAHAVEAKPHEVILQSREVCTASFDLRNALRHGTTGYGELLIDANKYDRALLFARPRRRPPTGHALPAEQEAGMRSTRPPPARRKRVRSAGLARACHLERFDVDSYPSLLPTAEWGINPKRLPSRSRAAQAHTGLRCDVHALAQPTLSDHQPHSGRYSAFTEIVAFCSSFTRSTPSG
jgi:hypothetical protein